MYEAVVIGVSKGGMAALKMILSAMPQDLSIPVIIVQHQAPSEGSNLAQLLNSMVAIEVREAQLGEIVAAGSVYLSVAGYHLLIEKDKTFSLSVDPPVNFSRPSIDVLFESAADAYGDKLVGIVLTGANADGSQGLKRIAKNGGLTVVQDPETAEASAMPEAAIAATDVNHVLSLSDIADFIKGLANDK